MESPNKPNAQTTGPVVAVDNPIVVSGEGIMGAEVIPRSQALETIREYRADTKYDEILTWANSVFGYDTKLDPQRELISLTSLDDVAERGTLWIDNSLRLPKTRRFIVDIGSALGEDGEQLLRQVASFEGEAKISFPIGEGVNITFGSADKKLARLAHRIEVDKEIDIATRTQTLQTFLDKLATSEKDFNAQIDGLVKRLRDGEISVFTDKTFRFDKNPDEILSFLSINTRVPGLLSQSWNKGGLATWRQHTVETLYGLPAHYVKSNETLPTEQGLYFDERGHLLKINIATLQPGLYLSLRSAEPDSNANLNGIDLQLGLEVDPQDVYSELDYNWNRYEGVKPFIETPTAAQTLATFEASGLKISSKAIDSFAEVGQINKRYGHGYADLTREIAKLINDPNRSINELFEGDPDEIKQRLLDLKTPDDLAAREVISLLKGVVSRGAKAEGDVIELPLSSHRVEIRDGSCKDIEVYIAGGQGVVNDSQNQPLLYRSAYRRPTAITLRPVILNGVELPAGALLAAEEDGYLFMRITSFAFDTEEAAQVFGAQYAENHLHIRSFAENEIRELILSQSQGEK